MCGCALSPVTPGFWQVLWPQNQGGCTNLGWTKGVSRGLEGPVCPTRYQVVSWHWGQEAGKEKGPYRQRQREEWMMNKERKKKKKKDVPVLLVMCCVTQRVVLTISTACKVRQQGETVRRDNKTIQIHGKNKKQFQVKRLIQWILQHNMLNLSISTQTPTVSSPHSCPLPHPHWYIA